MRLVGINNLYNNDYNVVKVSKNISIIGRTTLNSNITLLKDKTDDEKRKIVIENVINNNKISRVLSENSKYVIISLDGKELLIEKEYITDELLYEIYNKYYLDRMEYYNLNKVDCYEIVTSSIDNYNYYEERVNKEYGMEGILRNKRIMKIFIPLLNDKLSIGDELFLNKLLDDISDVMWYNSGWFNNAIYEATKDDRVIYLSVDKELSFFLCKLRDKQDDERDIKIKKMKERYL